MHHFTAHRRMDRADPDATPGMTTFTRPMLLDAARDLEPGTSRDDKQRMCSGFGPVRYSARQ